MTTKKTQFVCSIYKERPITCIEYPWNFANQIFADCIFVDMENERLRTYEEQLAVNSEKEISDYCVGCGKCCFYGPAPCSKLQIVQIDEPKEEQKNEA